MKKTLLLLLIPFIGFSQNMDNLFSKEGEIYFSYEYENKNHINELYKIISIDHKTNAAIAYAYANKFEFAKFLQKGISYQLIEKKPLNYINNSKNTWNYYPTYTEYTNMMQAFADSFPNICNLHHLGTLSSGREILILQISDNVGQKENEPSFLSLDG